MRTDLVAAIIPTRDHPQRLLSQLTLFSEHGAHWQTVVADSTASNVRSPLRDEVEQLATWQVFPQDAGLYEKLATVIAGLETPFILVTPDRKITLPHAVDAALAHLLTHTDHVAATGYVLGFDVSDQAFDINRVIYFTPTIGDDDPLERQYHLMRRYQSSMWALFRRDALAKCVSLAARVPGIMFQEIAFMNALVLQGKLARLPVIFRVESSETSKTPIARLDPLFWFIDDARSFANHYLQYRSLLLDFISQNVDTGTRARDLPQLFDIIHAIWLRHNADGGILNHAARLKLGDAISPLPRAHPRPVWRDVTASDMVRTTRGRRDFVWREQVLNAEPRDEIHLTGSEMDIFERQLDRYFSILDNGSPASARMRDV